MTEADKRVAELLDRWLTSVELHAKYLKLDDAAYARVQDWPRHQRPTQWIVELARKRLLELRSQIDQRQQRNDASFADALELMAFLTTLLGAEHIERFIPLATRKPPDTAVSGTVERPRLKNGGDKGAAPRKAAPKPARPQATTATAHAKALAATAPEAPRRSSAPVAPPAAKPAAPPANLKVSKAVAIVVADAVRFLEWGREWPALASQIARLADRPAEAEVRAILRTHRDAILQRAKRPAD